MDPRIAVPSMEVLRGKAVPKSAVLGLMFQPNDKTARSRFDPVILCTHVDVERDQSFKAKFQLRNAEIVWPAGAFFLYRMGDGNSRIEPPGEDGWYTTAALALPETQFTEQCYMQACRDCFLWDPCITGVLPCGWFTHVTISPYHLKMRYDISAPKDPTFKEGDKTLVLTARGKGSLREILTFNKDLYLPQAWKTDAEKAAKEPTNSDTEE